MGIHFKLLAVLFTFLFSFASLAEVDNPNQMGIVTGSTTGTYIKFGQDMAGVTEEAGLSLLVKESQGSLANIRRMVSRENAGVGIVQSDVLGFLTRSSDPKMQHIANRLRLIFPFYNEEVHLYANKSITNIMDLQGKRVVYGTKGSGNWLTTTNLLHMMQVEPGEQLNLDPAAGATAVLTGKADAMFYVAGKPAKLFTTVDKIKDKPKYKELVKNVHMVPLNDPKMLQEYQSASLGAADYTWMESETPTIAVKAVLVGFDFSRKNDPYYKKRCKEMGVLGSSIRTNLDRLKTSGHPKWNEVNLDEDIGLWQRDQCSAKVVATRAPQKPKKNQQENILNQGLENCIRTGACE